jgi:gliding-associated putative ABC transporter substrate-binding component GldG
VRETADLRQQLTPFYRTGQLILDSVDFIPGQVDLVIVGRPLTDFSNAEKFKLDQYIMEGGRVIFLIEPVVVSIDSLRQNKAYVPYNTSTGLDDLLFKYGVRINVDLIQDLECAKIPLITNTTAQGPQYELFDWFYYPLASPLQSHPMTRNLDRVFTAFPSSIDTVSTQYAVKKTPILTSSRFSNKQGMPAAVSFEILRYPPDPSLFDSPQLPIGYLLEGQLSSAFVNRPADGAQIKYRDAGKKILERSADGKILVFSDAQIIENGFDPKTGELYPMGYQRFENRRYGNREFIVNAVEYLLDDRNIIDARNKRISPRFLNAVKAQEEKKKWQLLNVGFTILLLALCGIIYQIVRRRIYA